MNTQGIEFSPISETNFKGIKEVEAETALMHEGLRRLRDMQTAPVEGVIDEMSKVFPDGLPWQGWRRSKNIEEDAPGTPLPKRKPKK